MSATPATSSSTCPTLAAWPTRWSASPRREVRSSCRGRRGSPRGGAMRRRHGTSSAAGTLRTASPAGRGDVRRTTSAARCSAPTPARCLTGPATTPTLTWWQPSRATTPGGRTGSPGCRECASPPCGTWCSCCGCGTSRVAMAAEARPVRAPSHSRHHHVARGDDNSLVWRVRHVVVCVFLAGFALASEPGRMVADTKLDLVVDPVGFLVRSMRLWDPMAAAGQLQNQAYGYLFPMGPFFAAGHGMGLPEWVVQRLWWGLVLCTAYSGMVVLAHRLDVGSQTARMVGGVAFAASPHILTVLGPVSAEAWPMALSAWTLVPLVGVNERGSIRRAAFRSGLAVLCMGGINAVLTLTALLPAVVWLATRHLSTRSLRLAGAWVVAVVLASLWWVVPLLLLGRYSPPFLDYIESASVTTSTTSLVEVLRGTHDW